MHRFAHPSTEVVGPAAAPPARPAPTTRAGDADRRRVADLLQAHYVAGRLSSDELSERVDRSLGARTFGDLDQLLVDLPPIEAPEPDGSERRDRGNDVGHHGRAKAFRAHAISYALMMVLLTVIWLLTTPGGYFWPIWPAIGWGIGLASHGLAARYGSHQTSAAGC